ncbi:MAG: NAD-dependent deacylase [Candidatus Heimdallarchaeota archaeon]|nr:NAD-dependent deacylase [Candidatus Heimdallarchaeota archaeon]
MNQLVRKAAELIAYSHNIVTLTGAGVSTESGISDFRSPGGLWERFDSSEYAEYSAFLTHPEKFWSMHRELSTVILRAEPNDAHKVLSALEIEMKKNMVIITQNVDFLHSRAGNSRVLELHGSGETSKCLDCGKIFHYLELAQFLEKNTTVPRCDVCNGLIKPNVVLFGESLPTGVYIEAREAISSADLLLIIGSSLTVTPAAFLPHIALERKIPIIIINREPIPMDDFAEVVIHRTAGIVLKEIYNEIKNIIIK